jgi:hypothetical protein
MATEAENPNGLQIALSTIFPFVVGLLATKAAMHLGERSRWDTMPFILVGWPVLLGLSAVWLNQAAFRSTKMLRFFLAAVSMMLIVWCWQRRAFTLLIPNSDLTYGYFLNPNAHNARFWILSCPFTIGLACLSACLLAALVSGWRAGYRSLLMSMLPWWLTAFLVFALPSLYLVATGNATIFI